MEAEARRIRTAVRRHQQLRTDTGIRYPADLRARVLAHAAVMERSGASVKSIAGRLGVRPQLLAYWRKRSAGARMRPVAIDAVGERAVAPAGNGQLVLVTPGGVRVEGLDVEAVARLLRALS